MGLDAFWQSSDVVRNRIAGCLPNWRFDGGLAFSLLFLIDCRSRLCGRAGWRLSKKPVDLDSDLAWSQQEGASGVGIRRSVGKIPLEATAKLRVSMPSPSAPLLVCLRHAWLLWRFERGQMLGRLIRNNNRQT